MAIKCTYLELANVGPGLKKLMAVASGSVVERARIVRWAKTLLKELGEYERIRNEILTKYGTPIEGAAPGTFRVEKEKTGDFSEEMKKLHAIEAEIAVAPLPPTLWKLAELTVEELSGLGDFIELPSEDAVDEAPAAPAAPAPTAAPPVPLKPVK